MNRDDIELLRRIQKNTAMAMKTIDLVETKIREDRLSDEMMEHNAGFFRIHEAAGERLRKGKSQVFKTNPVDELLLAGSLYGGTIINTSASRIAELMIKESNREITQLHKALNHYAGADETTVEMARELVDFEERCVERYRKYL
ncbi:MAG: hypothetical protein IJC59_01490 [Lachnospiraceae bacterium]|nr:hypothetical protein [Lachnospiraceae bacterium]